MSQVRRRNFLLIAGAILAAPVTGIAQQQGKIWRIGHLAQGYSVDRTEASILEGFRHGLRDLGYVEGQNLIIEYRWGELIPLP
jgi:putative ABC transport system substrate-binding protein